MKTRFGGLCCPSSRKCPLWVKSGHLRNADDVYRRDMTGNNAAAFARVSGLASVPNDRGGNQPSISGDGRFVAFTSASNFDPNDTNNADDVYRRDMTGNNAAAFSRVSELASVPNDRGGNQPSISDDGRFIAFTSVSNFDPNDTNGAADVYRRDMTGNNAAAFSRVSGLASVPNDRGGNQPSISANGRFVVFISASNFDPNDTNNADDAYRRDMCP